MTFDDLLAGLKDKKAAIHMVESGAPVRRSYAGLHADVAVAGEALRGWGVRAGMRVGIYAPNSYRWLVYDLALIAVEAVSVPFTDDFQGSVDDELLARYGIALLLTSKSHARLFPGRPAHVVYIDQENNGVAVIPRGGAADADIQDQLSLVFSSGSAGGLKGLVISRKGVLSSLPPIMDTAGMTGGDRLLLFLPLSNFQQRFLFYGALWYDFDIILTEYAQLFTAMEKLHPTVLVAPPILYQMVHADFLKGPSWKRALQISLGAVLSLLPSAGARRAIARNLFADFYRQFGNNIRVLITGMAPIQRSMGEFFGQMQLPLCEAYGMVEAGVIAYRPAEARNLDSVGKPLRDVHFSFESDGEIIVNRTHPVALRYFQCAEGENERTFLGPDRIATGDLGTLDADGNLILLGRKKALILLPDGRKIHPETIEAELRNCPDVAQAVAFLKRDAAHLKCVIALNEPGSKAAEKRILAFVSTLKLARKTMPFLEVMFADIPFTSANGMLRPNLKIDRQRIVAQYNRA